MTHKPERSLSSLSAIAAATLLLSTPALAQSQPATDGAAAQPPVSAATPPDPQPAPAAQAPATPDTSAPTPAAPAPTVTTNPVVQPIPDNSAPPTTQTPAPSAPTAATPPARPAAQPRSSTHTVTRSATTGGIPAATPAQKPTPTDAPSPGLTRRDPAGLYTAEGTSVTNTTTKTATPPPSPYARYWPLEAAGGIVVLGLIGYAFTRRREEDEEEVYTTPVTEGPVAESPAAATPAAASVTTAMPVTAARPLAQAHSATLDTDEAPSASVLPAGPVPTGAEREALLQRMVDAPPDAANPFRTVKARMRRARMILASRKQALREQATKAFDWRTYQPSLKPATLGSEAPAKPAATRTRRETAK